MNRLERKNVGPARVLVVDDHAVVREGIKDILANEPDLVVVGEAGDGVACLKEVERLRPDVVILDIRIPFADGVEVARQLNRRFVDTRIVMMTSYEDEAYLRAGIEAGVDAFVLKCISPANLLSAVRAVARGEKYLGKEVIGPVLKQFSRMAQQETLDSLGVEDFDVEILQEIAHGATNKDIANKHFWSDTTVKRKIQDIFKKLGVTDRSQAVAEAMRRGLI